MTVVRIAGGRSRVDGPPAVAVHAAVGAVGPGRHVVQVRAHHAGAAGPGAVDAGGGVEQVLVHAQILAAERGGAAGGRGEVDVAFVRLVHLRLVGEEDLGLRAAGGGGT